MPVSAPSKPTTILVALELSEDDDLLIDVGVGYARTFGARLILAHVAMATGESEGDDLADRPALDLSARHASVEAQGVDVDAVQFTGVPSERLAEQAEEVGADLIIAGHRQRTALGEIVFGSTSRGLLSDAPCPVLLIRLHT